MTILYIVLILVFIVLVVIFVKLAAIKQSLDIINSLAAQDYGIVKNKLNVIDSCISNVYNRLPQPTDYDKKMLKRIYKIVWNKSTSPLDEMSDRNLYKEVLDYLEDKYKDEISF